MSKRIVGLLAIALAMPALAFGTGTGPGPGAAASPGTRDLSALYTAGDLVCPAADA